jgi:hypothetical protein
MHVAFREGNRGDAAFIQFGDIAVPNQSDHIHLVATRPGSDSPVAASIPFSADQDDTESNPSPTLGADSPDGVNCATSTCDATRS